MHFVTTQLYAKAQNKSQPRLFGTYVPLSALIQRIACWAIQTINQADLDKLNICDVSKVLQAISHVLFVLFLILQPFCRATRTLLA